MVWMIGPAVDFDQYLFLPGTAWQKGCGANNHVKLLCSHEVCYPSLKLLISMYTQSVDFYIWHEVQEICWHAIVLHSCVLTVHRVRMPKKKCGGGSCVILLVGWGCRWGCRWECGWGCKWGCNDGAMRMYLLYYHGLEPCPLHSSHLVPTIDSKHWGSRLHLSWVKGVHEGGIRTSPVLAHLPMQSMASQLVLIVNTSGMPVMHGINDARVEY